MRWNDSQQLNHMEFAFSETLHFLMSHKAETWYTLEKVVNRWSREVTVVEMMKRKDSSQG